MEQRSETGQVCWRGSERIRRNRGGRHWGRVSNRDRVSDSVSRNVGKSSSQPGKQWIGCWQAGMLSEAYFPKVDVGDAEKWEHQASSPCRGLEGLADTAAGSHCWDGGSQSWKAWEAEREGVDRIDLGVTAQRGLAVPYYGAAFLMICYLFIVGFKLLKFF